MNTISLVIQAHKKPSNPSSAAKLAPVPTKLAPLRSRKSACEDHFTYYFNGMPGKSSNFFRYFSSKSTTVEQHSCSSSCRTALAFHTGMLV